MRAKERDRPQCNGIIVGDFNIPLSALSRSSRKKINKEASDLIWTIDQMDLTDIYRITQQIATEDIFFSSEHGLFSKIYHVLDHKTSHKHFLKNENYIKYLI